MWSMVSVQNSGCTPALVEAKAWPSEGVAFSRCGSQKVQPSKKAWPTTTTTTEY